MAAVQHTRTRSTRLGATTTKPLSLHTNGAGVSLSSTHGISSLSIFLTNLRLPDLDLLPDWPEISAATFATTGTSAQGQKRRVQSVEWALFQLFALWDPEETRNKLKPFFPPLDQHQSLNLRAALLRALEQAKKTGVLGRDAIVRKTMLDECKGERLEEVLAAFSSTVLKKVIVEEISASGEHPALALTLACEERGYKDEKTELITLALAHRASLRALLEGKAVARARYRDFADLLSVKERGIARKSEEIRAKEEVSVTKTLSKDAKLDMWRIVRDNWSGNERWMETLLHDDFDAKKDGLLAMDFDRVWRRVQQGRLGELEECGSGLLEQLDDRVKVQRERLEKWEGFKQRMCGDQPEPSPSKEKSPERRNKGIDLGFGAHEALRVGRTSPRKLTLGKKESKLTGDYADLVQGLQDDLAKSATRDPSAALAFLHKHRQVRQLQMEDYEAARKQEEEEISEMSELEDEAEEEENLPTASPTKSFQTRLEMSKRPPVRPRLSNSSGSYSSPKSSSSSSPIRSQSIPIARGRSVSSAGLTQSPASSPSWKTAQKRSSARISPPCSPPQKQRIPVASPPSSRTVASPTQDLADQILQSMDNASPSPLKRIRPTLSLTERARFSMARTSSLFLADEEPELPLTATPTNGKASVVEDDSQDEIDDLASRTRKSMANFDKTRQKAQLDQRRSLRRAKLPPRKEGDHFPKVDEDEQEKTILAEELMAKEDMEAVFRSRPKIKASPLPSPTKGWYEGDE